MIPALPDGVAESLAASALLAVLVFAVTRPRGLPEAVAAVPAAALLVFLGVIAPAEAWVQVVRIAPTIGFLAGVLMLAHLAQAEGVFAAAGELMAAGSRGRPTRLLVLVFAVASSPRPCSVWTRLWCC